MTDPIVTTTSGQVGGGRIDDHGVLYVVDRIKDMIVSGGENVYSGEERWGERVHAVVVARKGGGLNDRGIIDHCRTLIAGFKRPRSVAFKPALPLYAAGKVLKAELRAPFRKGRGRNVA